MTDELKHFGVLGMRWGRRKSQDTVMKPTYQYREKNGDLVSVYGKDPLAGAKVKVYGNRALTREENRNEMAARTAATSKSPNPHAERKEADIILDRAMRESGTNIDKALNRFASENDLKSAIKKGYVAPPKKNVEEMSTKEIDDMLASDPSIKQHLQKDFDKSVKRGKIIAAAAITAVATVKVAGIVADQLAKRRAMRAIFEAGFKIP